MKKCPTCSRTYSDETLSFCLDDGSLLSASIHSEPTIAFSRSFETPTQTANRSIPEKKRRNVAGLVIVILAVLIAGSTVALYYESLNRGGSTAVPIPSRNAQIPIPPANLPVPTGDVMGTNPPTQARSGTPSAEVQSPTTTDTESAISRAVGDWRENLRDKRLDGHMRLYADRLETYFRKSDVSSSFVRSDVSRLFQKYDSFNIEISNLRISGTPGGDAVATFDSDFRFVGTKTHAGKVHSELRWRNINGEWKIVSQRDLRTYFLRK